MTRLRFIIPLSVLFLANTAPPPVVTSDPLTLVGKNHSPCLVVRQQLGLSVMQTRAFELLPISLRETVLLAGTTTPLRERYTPELNNVPCFTMGSEMASIDYLPTVTLAVPDCDSLSGRSEDVELTVAVQV